MEKWDRKPKDDQGGQANAAGEEVGVEGGRQNWWEVVGIGVLL